MRRSNDWMTVLATVVLFAFLGLAGLALAGLLTGLLLFLAIFAVGLAVVGSVGFAVASVLRLTVRRQQRETAYRRLDPPGQLTPVRSGHGVPRRPGA